MSGNPQSNWNSSIFSNQPAMTASESSGHHRPNLVLITTDQQRWDAMSLAGHPELTTPILDNWAAEGAWCRRAYTPCPVCSPARQTMMTGCSPATNGLLCNGPARIPRPRQTLPALLREAGYQTGEIGRSMHQYPKYARYGFEFRKNSPFESHDSDVHKAIRCPPVGRSRIDVPLYLEHGMSADGYRARPWPYDEHFHQTTWTVNASIDFLNHRDRDMPFFLHVGFVAPHPPLVPPACYYDRYARQKLTEPVVGDWVTPPRNNAMGRYVESSYIPLGGPQIQQSMAGYYGLVNHVDDMLYNLQRALPENTVILFCSDHGEMLGDHYLFRKKQPFEASIRVPFLMLGPGIPNVTVDDPVDLADILPTVCDLAGVAVPDHIEGRSLLPLFRHRATTGGNAPNWREYIHSETSAWPEHGHHGWHALTDGKMKYIWWTGDGSELLFDVDADPRETRNLAGHAEHATTLVLWRGRLTHHLTGRPEGFVQNGCLTPGSIHRILMPHAVTRDNFA